MVILLGYAKSTRYRRPTLTARNGLRKPSKRLAKLDILIGFVVPI